MYEEIYQSAFENELQKIAKDKYEDPGYFKGLVGAAKAYYTDKPLSNIGRQLLGTVEGGIAGGGTGAVAGATAGGVAALLAKALKKGSSSKTIAVPAVLGSILGLIGGHAVGNAESYKKIMAGKGISVKNPYTFPRYSFTPEAAKKYNVKMDKAK